MGAVKRRLMVGLTLLGGLAAAMGLGLLSVPHEFEEGKTMSASGMNANLAAVHARIRAAGDSLEASRLVHMDFKGRLDEVFPEGERTSYLPDGLTRQQESPRVEPGSLADPSIVNGFFSGFAAQMSEADELALALFGELEALSERLTAAERAFGITVNEPAEVVVAPYTAPKLTEFWRNTRTVPGEMNDNFAAVITSLEPVEQNATELADWIVRLRSRLEVVEEAAGVGDPAEPGAVFQAAVGYLEPAVVSVNPPSYLLVLISFEPELPGDVVAVTITGPPGWNQGDPFELADGGRYEEGLHVVYGTPRSYMLDGEYTITAKVGGKAYTVKSTLDASLRFPDIPRDSIYVHDVDEDGIHLDWNPVAGAVSYQVRYLGADASLEDVLEDRYEYWVTRETSFTIPVPKSEIDETRLDRYHIRVSPRNFDTDPAASVNFSIQPRETSMHFLISPLPWVD